MREGEGMMLLGDRGSPSLVPPLLSPLSRPHDSPPGPWAPKRVVKGVSSPMGEEKREEEGSGGREEDWGFWVSPRAVPWLFWGSPSLGSSPLGRQMGTV